MQTAKTHQREVISSNPRSVGLVQRKCACGKHATKTEEDEKKKHRSIQRQPNEAQIPKEKSTAFYDSEIEQVVQQFNDRLNPDVPLDPDWVKAMVRIEAKEGGAPLEYDPLQVANKGDKALDVLSKAEEHSNLILNEDERSGLQNKKHTPWKKDKRIKGRGGKWDYAAVPPDQRMDSSTSIRTGVAWLFHRAALFNEVTIRPMGPPNTYRIQSGDTLGKIAKRHGSLVEELKSANPKINETNLREGDEILIPPAFKEWQITGWRSWEEAVKRYNSREHYLKKVKKVRDELKSAKSDVPVQRSATGFHGSEDIPNTVTSVLNSTGKALDNETCQFMENRLGHDFSSVRIHTDSSAARSAESIDATAYTSGSHVVFAPGAYNPRSSEGKQLLAHELTHVIQQQTVGNAVKPGIGAVDDSFEKEAEAVAHSITRESNLHRNKAGFQSRLTRTGESPTQSSVPRTSVNPIQRQKPKSSEEKTEAGSASNNATCQPRGVAGDLNPRNPGRVIRVAWTLDDGPTPATSDMRREILPRGGTWYIMRDRLPAGGPGLKNALAAMKKLQEEQGQEFAIHSMHPDKSHAAWFPTSAGKYVPRGYGNIQEAMSDLEKFVNLLRGAGLAIQFVRLPGGLLTEMVRYVTDRGILVNEKQAAESNLAVAGRELNEAEKASEVGQSRLKAATTDADRQAATSEIETARGRIEKSKRASQVAEEQIERIERARIGIVKRIIQGEDLTKLNAEQVSKILGKKKAETTQEDIVKFTRLVRPVQEDYKTMQSALQALNLELWGGSTGSQLTSPQSWQAESSGTGLTDDVTKKFEGKIKTVASSNQPEHLVVLAHDTDKRNAIEVRKDIAAMEDSAKKNGIRIEYYTMTGLFNCVRPQDAKPIQKKNQKRIQRANNTNERQEDKGKQDPVFAERQEAIQWLNQAIVIVDEAILARDRGEPLPNTVKDALNIYFKKESPRFLNLLRRRLQLVSRDLPHIPVEIKTSNLADDPNGHPACRKNPAFAIPRRYVGICNHHIFWESNKDNKDLKPGVLIHEAFHYAFDFMKNDHPVDNTRANPQAYHGFVSKLLDKDVGPGIKAKFPGSE